ncbi:hypothetical protein KP509_1Z091600 [Ceratopteris richardii]|nr:hypothetical protein KP509_1Z091600 [Ceratopteris richardii]
MNLGSEALEIPYPRFMVDDSSSVIEGRHKLLALVSEKLNTQDIEAEPKTPMPKERAIAIIQANERGRQNRWRIDQLVKIRKMQEEELQHKHSGAEALSVDAAVRKIQALARGFIARCRVRHSAEDELILIGMHEFWHDPSKEKMYQKLKENMERRKTIQALNKSNYDEAFLFAKEKVKELEGQEMREIIQEEINAWLLENLDPKTGFYPAFPRPDEGGSKYILNPPPRIEFAEEGKDKKGAVKKKSSVLKKVKLPEEGEDATARCPNFFRSHAMRSIRAYKEHWHDKDDSAILSQKHDPDILRSSLRPLIFEEVRVEVDHDTRIILNNIKKKLAAEAKFLKKDKPKESKGKGDESAKFVILDMGNKKSKKPPKDKSGQRSIESIFNELAENGIVQLCPQKSFNDFKGSDIVRTNIFDGSTVIEDPSLAQVRQLVTEYCVLPLASDFVHKNAPYAKSVLIYGGEGTGKTLLVHAACSAAGATFINLSPRNTDGKYPGSQLGKMLQMAFKIARIMAPTIIYIDEAELVFIKDKKKLRASGLKDKSSRIKKSLVKELSQLHPGDRVLLVGTSSKPQNAPSKAASLMTLFAKKIYVPYPDYASRVILWRTFLERHGAVLSYNFNLSILAHLSAQYSPGSMEAICQLVLSKKRLRKMRSHPLMPEEFVNHFHEFMPVDKATYASLKNWGKVPKPENDTESPKKK